MTPAEFRAWMKRNALSAQKAADRLGVSRRTIVGRLSGDVEITRETELACWAIEHGAQ